MVASVPLLVMRTFSMFGKKRQMVSAMSTSTRVGMP